MYFGDVADAINDHASISSQLGMSAGQARLTGYEGQSLPASTYTGQDRAAVPWSPDSPTFWLIGVLALTALGWVGASVNVRAGRARAGVKVND